jgi:hypothetical protein
VFVPDSVSMLVALFWVTPVTLTPMTALIRAFPVPVPLFVIEPVWLTLVVDSVMPLVSVLLLCRISAPVPATPPDTVSSFVPSGRVAPLTGAVELMAAPTCWTR